MHLHNWWQWLQQYCRDLYNSLCLILTSVWEYRSPQLTVSFWPWVPSSLTSSHPDERVRVPITTTHFTSSWPWGSSSPQFTLSHPEDRVRVPIPTTHFTSSWPWGSSSPQFTLSHPEERVRVPIPTTHFISSWPWVHPHHNSLYLILTHFFSSWRAW
jgi:hypothetical protein